MNELSISKNQKMIEPTHTVSTLKKSKKHRLVGFILIIVTGLLTWQCSKNMDTGAPVSSNSTLKASLTTGTQNVNKAVAEISKTYGYKILNVRDGQSLKSILTTKAAYLDSITLARISGVYQYHPVSYASWCYNCFSSLFTRTGDNPDLIVHLPEAKVFYPSRFQTVIPTDSTLKNNLGIDASDYHYYFSNGWLWDYKLNAAVTLNDTAIGNLAVFANRNMDSSYIYNSSYTFPNAYTIAENVAWGDTSSSSIALSGTSGVLLKEQVKRYLVTGKIYHEKEYTLDIGNVEFKKTSSMDSIQVFVGGILQVKSKIIIIDTSTGNGSLFGGRDIQITFDDGTTTTFSTLLAPSLSILNNLVVNLQNVYFASNIVDYIAINIFRNKTP